VNSISIEESYQRFRGAVMKAAHFSIPRGFRPRYIPCLDEESQVLLDQLEETGDTEVADHVIESLDAARCRRWEENRADEFYKVKSQELVTHPASLSRSKPTKNKPSSGESRRHR